MERIQLSKLFNGDIENFSPNITIMRINAIMAKLALDTIITYDREEILGKAKVIAIDFVNLMRRSYPDPDYSKTMNAIKGDIDSVYEWFSTRDEKEGMKYFALDIGLNSENDKTYTAVSKVIELFALAKKLGLEFDFS